MASDLLDLAHQTLQRAIRAGAEQAAVGVARSRFVALERRDGRLETVQESTTRGLSLRVYLGNAFTANSTSDLRPEALEAFVARAVELTRQIEPDPFRSLPDPALYADRPTLDLALHDPAIGGIEQPFRLRAVAELEEAARSGAGAERILSVSTGEYDTESQSALVHSNGFEGTRRSSHLWFWAETTVKDEGDKRPEGYASAGSRWVADQPSLQELGETSTRRALALLGARKIESGRMPVVVENRVASRMVGMLLSPLSGWALQQRRSFLEGRRGTAVGSHHLSFAEAPLLPKGLGSRLFDGEGISARSFPIFDQGQLANYYIDTYYGKKLGQPPTTGSVSNLEWAQGTRSLEAIIRDLPAGMLINSFLGGNSNDTTGDFSVGVRGHLIENGELSHPVSEMNLSGNQRELWKQLVEIGADPFPYSHLRCPTLVFEDLQLSGM